MPPGPPPLTAGRRSLLFVFAMSLHQSFGCDISAATDPNSWQRNAG